MNAPRLKAVAAMAGVDNVDLEVPDAASRW